MAAHRPSAGRDFPINDDDSADDLVEITFPAPSPLTTSLKRKSSPEEIEVEEKVVWTSDSDALPELASTRKQRKLAKGKGAVKPKGKDKPKAGAKKPSRSLQGLKDRVKDVDESEVNEVAEAKIPESLQRRRQEFNKEKKRLQEAGLRLPPDFSDIHFAEDDRLATLEERPQFPRNGFIKPCRPYKDVELETSAGIIPASIAQYLRDYQIVGVRFLHQLFVYQKGGILGDDMGLGKTVQVAAFLTAAFGKTGDERDGKRMRKIRRLEGQDDRWYPRVLIVCPGTLIENWKQELCRWGWWVLDTYHGTNKDDTLAAANAGRLEIMITTYDTYKTHRDKINAVQWDACVADECHAMKDRSSAVTKGMTEVNALCRIGLTGTAIQNNYDELWTLLNWTNPGMVGTPSEWRDCISKPLMIGQSHDATLTQLSRARTTAKKLVNNLLPQFFMRRMKSLIADQLPKKTDKVVFCPLTDIQMRAYENYLAGAHITQLRNLSDPCPCDSGRKTGWCCEKHLPDGRHWNAIVFPALINLMKIARHILLLVPDSANLPERQQRDLDVLQTCLPHEWETLSKQRDSLTALGNPELCGKWKVLRKMLRYWHENGDKVLIFSHSVRLLKILNHLFHNTSYSTSYLDGSLKYEERQRVVDEFNSDPAQFVFLISVKAGGTGLNITSANKVVIFDPHWNPSWDLQAQDRAYRIGQARDVDVFRLISAGTIEEIVYARQIYKQQQANIGYSASTERRYFRGVQQDKDRKGELFGLQNLFTYHSDSVILQDIVNKTNIAEAKAGVNLMQVNMDEVVADAPPGGTSDTDIIKKEEDDETGGLSQVAARLFAQDNDEVDQKKKAPDGSDPSSSSRPKIDAIQAILASAGVEYTHENSEVIGSSKVEASLSRRAELAAERAAAVKPDPDGDGNDAAPDSAPLFAPDEDDDDAEYDIDENGQFPELSQAFPESRRVFTSASARDSKTRRLRYNPPPDVQRRQFCSMAKEFGFGSATDFALVVESWTQEQRRGCLEKFYARREATLAANADTQDEEDEVEVKVEVKMEGVKGEVDVKIKKDEKDEGEREVVMSEIPAFVKEESPMEKKNPVVLLDDEETEDDEMGDTDAVVKDEVKVEEGRQPVITASSRATIFIYDDEEDPDEL